MHGPRLGPGLDEGERPPRNESSRVVPSRPDADLPDVRQLLDVRRQLAFVAISAPKPGQEASRRQAIDELEQQEEQLSRKTSQARGETFQAEPWIEVVAVREAIPASAVLVDTVRTREGSQNPFTSTKSSLMVGVPTNIEMLAANCPSTFTTA